MALRFDRGSLKPPRQMSDGRWRFDATLTRSGVFEYVDYSTGKVRREYRPPEEVFKQDSVDTLAALVVTNDHPTEMVTLDNVDRYLSGNLGDQVRRDGNHLASFMYVSDKRLLGEMTRARNPKREVSLGYRCDLDETPGVTPDGEHYDAVQRNIEYNHAAVVQFGRAGTAHVRMDSLATQPGSVHGVAYQKEPRNMSPDKRQDTATAAALQDALGKANELEAKLKVETARADAAEGKVESLEERIKKLQNERTDSDKVAELAASVEEQKERADKAEQAIAQIPALVAKGVKDRFDVINGATVIMGPKDEKGQDRRWDDLSDRQIIDLAIESATGKSMANKSDDYARSRFDTYVEQFGAGRQALSELSRRTRIDQAKAQEVARGREDNREQILKDRRDSHLKPLPSTVQYKRGRIS